MEIGDLLGFGKASEKLLDVVSNACGAAFKPKGIRREAAAKAEEIRLLGQASAEVDAERIRLVGAAEAENRLLVAQTDAAIYERMQARLAATEIRKQTSIESIVKIALEEVPDDVSATPVEGDWAVRFFDIAGDITDANMQALWGKILAGEVATPGRYSLRTLEVLRNLSRHEAELFQRMCGLAFDGGWVAKLESLDIPGAFQITPLPSKELSDFGVSYREILTLRAAGLVSETDDTSWIFNFPAPSTGETRQRAVAMTNGIAVVLEVDAGAGVTLPVFVLTPAGRELQALIPHSPNLPYLRRVAAGLAPRKIDLYRAAVVDGVIHADRREEL